MEEMPSKQQLILLVNSLCEIQDRIMSVKGMPKYIQQPIADKVEPLKAPMFFVWNRLGYGSPTELSPRGIKGYWIASFNTSPPDFLSECIQQLRSHEIPIAEYDKGLDLQQSLINFYSVLQQMRNEIVHSDIKNNLTSTMDFDYINDTEKKKQIEEAYQELNEIWEKEAAEKSDFYEELPEPDFSYMDYEDDDYDDLEDKKPKKTDGNKISIITMNGSTIIEETSKVIQSDKGKFGLYDIRFYQKGGFRVYKEYLMLYQREFYIDDIKSITFNKSEDKVIVSFRNSQRLSPNCNYYYDDMIFYVKYSHLYIDCFQGNTRISNSQCKFDKVGYGLDHLFEGFCSLADLEEGNALLMVNGNAYITNNLSYFYNESEIDNFGQLSETLVFHL